MPRSATTGRYLQHPSTDWSSTIKLVQGRRKEAPEAWEAIYLVGGQWGSPRSLTTTDFETAKARSVEKAKFILAGEPEPGKLLPRTVKTVAAAAEITLADLRASRATQGCVRNNTQLAKFDLRIRRIETVLLPAFGRQELLTANDQENLDRWALSYRTKGGGVPARSTIGQLNADWQAIMKDARLKTWIRGDQIGKLPTAVFKKGVRRADISEAEVNHLIRFLASNWIEEGHTEIVRQNRRMAAVYVAMLACTGIRPGTEIETLTWDRVEIDGQGVVKLLVLTEFAKTRQLRDVWAVTDPRWNLQQTLADYKEWRSRCNSDLHDKRNPEGFLFNRPRDGIKPNFSVCVRHMLDDAGILIDPKTKQTRAGYSFRHYYGTQRLADNVPLAVICDNMGTSLGMLNDHYRHRQSDEAATKLVAPRIWNKMPEAV